MWLDAGCRTEAPEALCMRTLGGAAQLRRVSRPPEARAPTVSLRLTRLVSHRDVGIALGQRLLEVGNLLEGAPALAPGGQVQPHETSPHFSTTLVTLGYSRLLSATLGYSRLLSAHLSATLGPSLGYSRLPATLGYSLGPFRLLSSLAGRAEPLEALCDIRRGRLGRHLRDACARGRFREGSEKAPLRGALTNSAFEEERVVATD